MKYIASRLLVLPQGLWVVYAVLGALIGVGLLVLAMPPADANHPYTSNSHVGTIHQNDANSSEGACTDSHTPDLSETYVRTRINGTLQFDDPSLSWDDKIDNKINIAMSTATCAELGYQGALGSIELRYRVYDDDYRLDAEGRVCNPWPGSEACALASEATYLNPNQNHYENSFYNMYFQEDVIYDDVGDNTGAAYRAHVVSHETGHAFNLKDPWPRDTECGTQTSVMHPEYYCRNLTTVRYPQAIDIDTVTTISQ